MPQPRRKVLITGATGLLAGPVADALAGEDEVWCLARFTNPERKAELEARGARTYAWNMLDPLDGLPDDFTHVLHSALHRDGDFAEVIDVNATSTARLMVHCRGARAFLHVSTTGVYSRQALDHRYRESDPTGGHTPWWPPYAPAKIAAEGVVRALARTLGLPSTIARMNVCYGPYARGGMPVVNLRHALDGRPILLPRGGNNHLTPIHTDDVVRQVPLLWDAASVPATVVNWAGDDTITDVQMMSWIAELTGVEPAFEESDESRDSFAADNTLRRELIGDCRVSWRDGIARTLAVHFPELAHKGGSP
jgi:nucleoside-diphosphate-sugar epimerase